MGFFSLPTKNPAHERIHPDYRLGCLRDRIERANLATYSSVKQRNGAVSLQEKKKVSEDDDFCKMKEGEDANWEGNVLLLYSIAKSINSILNTGMLSCRANPVCIRQA